MIDPLDIINNFMEWSPFTTGKPCPIDIRDENKVWFKRLCALAERCAKAENNLTITQERLLMAEKYLQKAAKYGLGIREAGKYFGQTNPKEGS